MISVVRMCDRISLALKRRHDTIRRRDARITVLEARVKGLAARIGVLNERLGQAKLADRTHRAELRELRKWQLKLKF